MGFARNYLAKCAPGYIPFEDRSPHIIVVVPCFSEPGITDTLLSLKAASSGDHPVEVIVVVNWPEDAGREEALLNHKIFIELQEWAEARSCSSFWVYPLCYGDLPARESGAGPARRIGMDLAVARFNMDNNSGGVIISTDADSLFDSNYISEISRCFADKRVNTASIYFEHPLEGDEHHPSVYEAIAQYELYLRCYVESLRSAGHPHAFHTIGSSFAVRASAYVKQGGMNNRKAGEDFYFLQKMMLLGGYSEINSTRVIPSPRISGRVPFGTGPAVRRLSAPGAQLQQMYNYGAFNDISLLLEKREHFFETGKAECRNIVKGLPESVRSYLTENGFMEVVEEMRGNSASCTTFVKRFFAWFNGFRVLKFLNHAHNRYYEKIPVTVAAAVLAERYGIKTSPDEGAARLLNVFRNIQRDKERFLE